VVVAEEIAAVAVAEETTGVAAVAETTAILKNAIDPFMNIIESPGTQYRVFYFRIPAPIIGWSQQLYLLLGSSHFMYTFITTSLLHELI
jgi:hypothetical protein